MRHRTQGVPACRPTASVSRRKNAPLGPFRARYCCFFMRHMNNSKTVRLKKSSTPTLQSVLASPVSGFVSSFMDDSGTSRVTMTAPKASSSHAHPGRGQKGCSARTDAQGGAQRATPLRHTPDPPQPFSRTTTFHLAGVAALIIF